MITSNTTAAISQEELANLCLDHLRCEIQCMARINESLLLVREALVAIDASALANALETQRQAAIDLARLRGDRLQLRAGIASGLELRNDTATVRGLAERLQPPWNRLLHAAREELRGLVIRSRRLAEGNALLTHNWSRVINRVLEQITGQPTPAERYSAQGTKDSPPPASIIQARC